MQMVHLCQLHRIIDRFLLIPSTKMQTSEKKRTNISPRQITGSIKTTDATLEQGFLLTELLKYAFGAKWNSKMKP